MSFREHDPEVTLFPASPCPVCDTWPRGGELLFEEMPDGTLRAHHRDCNVGREMVARQSAAK